VKIIFNENKARDVFSVINNHWQYKTGVFRNVVLPQDQWELPKNATDLALLLFYAALFMRGGINSEDAFRWIYRVWLKQPDLFVPAVIMEKHTPETIEAVFRLAESQYSENNGSKKTNPLHYKADQHSRAWIENSRYLLDKWKGDPLGIFDGVATFEEAFSKINRKVIGMRRKIFSLYTIWLQEKKLIPLFPTPIPVDFHALRILWATKIMSLEDLPPFNSNGTYPEVLHGKVAMRMRESLIDTVAMWSQNFLGPTLSHTNINPALWVLSRDLCAMHHQNSSRKNGMVLVEASELRHNPDAWPANYKNPCFFCPIEKWCTGTVPAAPYYRWGVLLRTERVHYAPRQLLLPTINWNQYCRIPKRRKKK
jgi:hypothetical protein